MQDVEKAKGRWNKVVLGGKLRLCLSRLFVIPEMVQQTVLHCGITDTQSRILRRITQSSCVMSSRTSEKERERRTDRGRLVR